jgi:hypothetical protein
VGGGLEDRQHHRPGRPDIVRPGKPSVILVALLALSSLGSQCRGNDQISFEIDIPGAANAAAKWLEIGVIDGACPAATQLAGGIPRSGTVTRVAFPKGDTSPPSLGNLARASYAFAAVARDANCGIVATGCSVVDLAKSKAVTVTLAGTQRATGACVAGEQCAYGECLPTRGSNDPTLGAGCSMQLLGAGPLGDPFVLNGGDVVSAPAVVATEKGFLLAYREYDVSGGRARMTLAAIDDGGGLTLASPTMLPAQCPGQLETDAIGLAYESAGGVAVSARPGCPGQQGALDAFAVDATGAVGQSVSNASFGPGPTLSNAHSVSLTGAASGWVALLESQSAEVAALSGLTTQGGPTPFGGPPPQTLAEVVATDRMVALLSASGAAGGGFDGGAPDATVPPSTLSLFLTASPSADAGAPVRIPGDWGALTAQAGRAFVLSGAVGGSSSVVWAAVDLGAAAPAAADAVALPGPGAALGGDIALHGDRLMLAVEQPGAVAVAVYDHASTMPTPLRYLLLSDDPRIPPQSSVRDGRLALAVSDSRVAVVWVTAANLGPNDAVGGYAVYACSP